MIRKSYEFLKRISFVRTMMNTRSWKILRYRITARFDRRRNCNFTRFMRLPTQFEALCGPVLNELSKSGITKSLKIIVLGCSNGAEAYSIASILRNRFPGFDFNIDAYDIDQGCISKAQNAVYTPDEVFNKEILAVRGRTDIQDFVDTAFERRNGIYVVRKEIKNHVHFDLVDALSPDLEKRTGTSDIVFAQHFLIHMKHQDAKRAFHNIYQILNPKGVLFIAGIDLDILLKLTRKYNLKPLDYEIEQIYKEVCCYNSGWPWNYWSSEPFLAIRKEWKRRYATIFYKSEESC